MQNNKPEFTDKELEIIERTLSTGPPYSIYGSVEELSEIVLKANDYRLGIRKCKSCNMDKKVELFVWDQPEYCVLCAPWYKDQDLVFTDKDTIYCKKCGETYTSPEEDSEFFYVQSQLFTCRKCGAKYESRDHRQERIRRELVSKTKAARVELGEDGKVKAVYIDGRLVSNN